MPFSVKLEKRLEPSQTVAYLVPVASFALALLFGAVLLALAGANPWHTYRAMLEGAFGTPAQWQAGQFYSLTETLVKATPLILAGLGVSIAFRMLFWNIGAEGQLVMGGFAAGAVALWLPPMLPGWPTWIFLPIMEVAGMMGGAFWGLIPAVLKAYLKVNEIITTLMLNYIAILWVQYLYYGPWKDPQGYGFPGTAQFPEYTWLPRITGRVHLGFVFGLIAAALIWLVLDRTRWGYEIRLIGENPRAARYAGVSIARNIVLVMCLSGGLAGLAGWHGRCGWHLVPAAAGTGSRLRVHRHHRRLAGQAQSVGHHPGFHSFGWAVGGWRPDPDRHGIASLDGIGAPGRHPVLHAGRQYLHQLPAAPGTIRPIHFHVRDGRVTQWRSPSLHPS